MTAHKIKCVAHAASILALAARGSLASAHLDSSHTDWSRNAYETRRLNGVTRR